MTWPPKSKGSAVSVAFFSGKLSCPNSVQMFFLFRLFVLFRNRSTEFCAPMAIMEKDFKIQGSPDFRWKEGESSPTAILPSRDGIVGMVSGIRDPNSRVGNW